MEIITRFLSTKVKFSYLSIATSITVTAYLGYCGWMKTEGEFFKKFYSSGKTHIVDLLNGSRDGYQVIYYENGNMKYEAVRGKKAGEVFYKNYYKSGEVFIIGSKKGRKENNTKYIFYENGKLWIAENYKNGALHGAYVEFNVTGKLKTVGIYASNELIYQVEYDEKGNLARKEFYLI